MISKHLGRTLFTVPSRIRDMFCRIAFFRILYLFYAESKGYVLEAQFIIFFFRHYSRGFCFY